MLLVRKCLDKPDRKKLFASDCYLNWKIFLYRIPNLFETLSPPIQMVPHFFDPHPTKRIYSCPDDTLHTLYPVSSGSASIRLQ